MNITFTITLPRLVRFGVYQDFSRLEPALRVLTRNKSLRFLELGYDENCRQVAIAYRGKISKRTIEALTKGEVFDTDQIDDK